VATEGLSLVLLGTLAADPELAEVALAEDEAEGHNYWPASRCVVAAVINYWQASESGGGQRNLGEWLGVQDLAL
jgi:hypothetical protein